MKCKYTFLAFATAKFPTGIALDVSGHTYEIETKDGRLSSISVTVSDYPDESLPTFIPLQNQLAMAQVSVPHDSARDLIIGHIRTIEGGLCLLGVDEINTDEIQVEWIPESEADQRKLKIFKFSYHRDNTRDREIDTNLNLAARIIHGFTGFIDSEIPLNFFRRGKKDMREQRYIDAIYDFFFVLETLFGNGKFHKSALEKEFNGAVELVDAITYLKLQANDPIFSPPQLSDAYQERMRETAVEELISEIIELRGYLHHHTLKRPGIWHPANQREFHLDCIIVLNICQHVLTRRVMGHLFDDEISSEFMSTDVFTSEGQKINWVSNNEPYEF